MKKTSRRNFIKTTGGLVVSATALPAFPAIISMQKKSGRKIRPAASGPNILLITTDTSRCDTVNAMGYPFAVSPNLDRLAGEGVLFRNAHTASPVCSPARCSLLTGVHTPIHGCIENGVSRRTDLTTFPDLLKERGYHTIMVGKTHFGPIPDSFDVQKVLKGGKNSNAEDIYGDFIRNRGYSRKLEAYPSSLPQDVHIDSFLVDTTIAEIRNSMDESDSPFFVFCSIPSPHPPLDPPREWVGTYEHISLPPLNYTENEFEKLPQYLIDHLDLKDPGQYDMEKINRTRRLYYDLAAYCDAQIGRLIQFLDESGLRENTLVIFSSDHGTTLFDHGFKNKHTFYDAAWRVPLIISMPGTIPEGGVREFAIWNDITASILGAAGMESDIVQGFDLYSPLKEDRKSPRRCAVSVHHRQCALATRKWKIIYEYDYESGRLFDRNNDPKEQNNLWDNSDYSDVQNALFRTLLQWNSELIDIERLKKNSGGGGRVARITAQYTSKMSGTDAEHRLNERCEKIDHMY